eukprot:scaffold2514_cov158-Ochromonas_danica.AAC.2
MRKNEHRLVDRQPEVIEMDFKVVYCYENPKERGLGFVYSRRQSEAVIETRFIAFPERLVETIDRGIIPVVILRSLCLDLGAIDSYLTTEMCRTLHMLMVTLGYERLYHISSSEILYRLIEVWSMVMLDVVVMMLSGVVDNNGIVWAGQH